MNMKYGEAKKYILKRLRDELSPHLYYHGLQHTLDILRSAINIGEQEKISKYEMQLLKSAALFHDAGFMISKKNTPLIFSVIINNHNGSASSISTQVEGFLRLIREHY